MGTVLPAAEEAEEGGVGGRQRKPDSSGSPVPAPTRPGAPLPADEKGSYAAPGDTASPGRRALGARGLGGPAAADTDEVGSDEDEAEAQTQAGQGRHQQQGLGKGRRQWRRMGSPLPQVGSWALSLEELGPWREAHVLGSSSALPTEAV